MVNHIKYKQRWVPGAIVQINLGRNLYGYAQVLEYPLIAFYDFKSTGELFPSAEEIKKSNVLFKVSVTKTSVTQNWKIIYKTHIDQELNKWPDEYRYDSETDKYFIRKETGPEIPTTWSECKNLERALLWGTKNIERRLRDYFSGRPCYDVEAFKPGWKFIPITDFYKKYGYDIEEENRE